jgi:hypothetical protein
MPSATRAPKRSRSFTAHAAASVGCSAVITETATIAWGSTKNSWALWYELTSPGSPPFANRSTTHSAIWLRTT